MLDLHSQIKYIKGVGPKRALLFEKLGIKTAKDALIFFPLKYQDRTKICSIKQAFFYPQVSVFGQIGKCYQRHTKNRLAVLDVEFFDGQSKTYIRFYRRHNPYAHFDIFASIKKIFENSKYAYVYGTPKKELNAAFILTEDYEIIQNKHDNPSYFNKIIPIYHATEGLNQKNIRETVKTIIDETSNSYPDISNLIPYFNGLIKMKSGSAIQKIHYPATLEEAENARRTFAFQEFFVLETALSIFRKKNKKNFKQQKYEIKKSLLSPFKKALKFNFTNDQKKAINEIFADMQKPYQMNRMLMGDVGCGKTVVALSAILLAVENGFQTMIIAPTEILAEQHFLTISNLLYSLDIPITLATSSTLRKKKEREKIILGIQSGKIKIAIGTHALIEDRIGFKNLSLIIVDEQHRFGVMQKFAAALKSSTPDILMMTATPIPRALAMTVYGEMDLTIISHLPPGRIPIKTFYSSEQTAYQKTIEELEKGNQAYIVYPLVDESDKLELKAASVEAEKLSQSVFKSFKVGLLHGKMKPVEKNEIMKKFKAKEFNVLISTTVIEVGIDAPDATVMIIQHAERFGLSALHQLRGRIGRSSKPSFTYLVSNSKTLNSQKRISIITSTNNGFEIAQEDLKMRGPGEIIGVAQHGFPEFKAGDLIKDADIIEWTKDYSTQLIENDPELSKTENAVLKTLVSDLFLNKINLIKIG
ncbi:MAG: ATP-dependent DNA helicase RecG [Elusimicrobiota bacterium]|jgi:ATP-dependent DNA helicase RecG|nr:ATP-dependent DNA helicase RecG [Elusimicrobiota bacterium]